jgi:hypothetical protein
MTMKLLVTLIFVAAAALAHAEMRQSDESIHLSVPGILWELRFPKQGLQPQVERITQNGRGCYHMFSNSNTHLNASFYIEPAGKCKTSWECRRMVWSKWNHETYKEDPQSVEQFDLNGFAVIKFIVPRFKGIQVDQLNYSGHIVRNGYWVDMHLSKMQSQKGDETLLSGFAKSVSFQKKSAVAANASQNERRYSLGDYGFFRIDIPPSWKDELRQPPDRTPPTIVLSPKTGVPFRVLVTAIWGAKMEKLKDESIRELVQKSAERVKPQAVEKTLQLVELRGTSGKGYYFFVTDKAPKPDEYKYMTQGAMVVGDLLVTFTVLTNGNHEEVTKEALTMLREARHLN